MYRFSLFHTYPVSHTPVESSLLPVLKMMQLCLSIHLSAYLLPSIVVSALLVLAGKCCSQSPIQLSDCQIYVSLWVNWLLDIRICARVSGVSLRGVCGVSLRGVCGVSLHGVCGVSLRSVYGVSLCGVCTYTHAYASMHTYGHIL